MSRHTPSAYIAGFDTAELSLDSLGGKGVGLARLVREGFPVPDGFILTSSAYAEFLRATCLADQIHDVLAAHRLDEAAELDRCSAIIRHLFAPGVLPPAAAGELLRAYRALGAPSVAVRSSATAEDLPDASFAGQQETYLNVAGESALLEAVKDCWSSLWTARAIGYRARRGISGDGLLLAVVVQRMVESEVSGVLFTANPITGLRREVVIDATLGLGEALVSGLVEPDHYVVDPGSGVVKKELGRKATTMRSKPGGGVAAQHADTSGTQALPDAWILELAKLGKDVEARFGSPQDVEWALEAGSLYLLQSRPITSLYPLPVRSAPEPLRVYLSFAAVQGLPDPLTPLGRDFLRQLFAVGAGLFGIRRTLESQGALFAAGERMWVDFTTPFRNPVGRRVVRAALRIVEPSAAQAIESLEFEPSLAPIGVGLGARSLYRLSRFVPRLARNVALNLIAPRARRRFILSNGERLLDDVRKAAAAVSGDPWSRLLQRAALLPTLAARELPRALVLYLSAVVSGMAPFALLNRLSSRLSGNRPGAAWSDTALEISRGMPSNPTTVMDLSLWTLAGLIRSDGPSFAAFREHAASELAALYLAGGLPKAAQDGMKSFMQAYGDRGLAELDLGRPRWREEPAHIVQSIINYLRLEDAEDAPDAVFRRGAERAARAVEKLVAGLRGLRHGRLASRVARWLAGRMRALLGMREEPKFFAVRLMGVLRSALLESGTDFARAGILGAADDVLYLNLSELRAMARREPRDWLALVASRRGAAARERGRRQIPRVLLSDGRCFYEGMSGDGGEGEIVGAPVSPGTVEGVVRVVFDPREAALEPGEILVCPGTDPSWTPLFLTAGGLVMEVGGMMTHGAVVAREYGIPAVVGVHEACTRLTNGHRIRLDGSTGRITILTEPVS